MHSIDQVLITPSFREAAFFAGFLSLCRILLYEKKVLYQYYPYLEFHKFLSDVSIFRANLIFGLYLCKQKQHVAFTK